MLFKIYLEQCSSYLSVNFCVPLIWPLNSVIFFTTAVGFFISEYYIGMHCGVFLRLFWETYFLAALIY
jgi:hypothetical protein